MNALYRASLTCLLISATFCYAVTGTHWERLTQNAPWGMRTGQETLVGQGKLWMIGGRDSSREYSDVWATEDGSNWTCVTSSAPWHTRAYHRCLFYDNKLWVLGGSYSPLTYLNDVWSSEDGTNWTMATAQAPWGGRNCFGADVFDGKMWVLGGYNGDKADVWSSTDGTNWQCVTMQAPYGYRAWFDTAVLGGKMYLLGSEYYSVGRNDVWASADGTNWARQTAAAPWGVRAGHGVTVLDDTMYLAGGSYPSMKNDVWMSTDGTNWARCTDNAQWSARPGVFGLASFNERLWMIDGNCQADVWYTAEEEPGTNADIIAWYKFDNGQDLGYDSSGNGHHGVNHGAVAGGRGPVNGCVYFEGNGQYIQVPDHRDFQATNFTVAFWLRTPTDGYQAGQNRIMAKWRREAITEGWYGHITGDDGVSVVSGDGTPNVERSLMVTNTGRLGWVHVAYQLEMNRCAMYTNGVLAASTNWLQPATLTTDADLCMGGFSSWGWASLQGWLDEVKIWARVLTPEDIAQEAAKRGTQTVAAVVITTAELPHAHAGMPYLAGLTATGGTAPYTWTLISGNLPAGISLCNTGTLCGTATMLGTAHFTVGVRDADYTVATHTFDLPVSLLPATQTNLIAWYAFDDPTDLGCDTSGNGHHATDCGAQYAAQGVVAGCAYFDGATMYMRVPHHQDFLNTNITVAFWLRTPTAGYQAGKNRIMAKWRREAITEGWYGHITGDDGVSVVSGDGTPNVERSLMVTNAGRLGWVHVAYQIASDRCAVYTNGVLAASTNWPAPACLLTDADLCIGGFNSWGWAWLHGWLDEVKIWGRALAVDEIAREAHRPQPPFVTVAPTQQVVCAGQVATLAIEYGDSDGTAELTINGAPAAAVVNSNKTSLTWTPSAGDVGRHVIDFVATDNDLLTASATALIIVTQRIDRLEIVTAALPDGTVNVPYDAVLQAAGGVRPYAWTISGGALPDGITLATNGTLAGQTAVAGRYAFMVRVTDGNSQFVERLFALSVADGTPATVRILTAALPDALVGEAYAVMLKASGGMAPYAWEIVDGFLPDGMSLNPSNGVVRGTALVATNAFFIVMVTDHNGNCDSKPLVIRVRPEDDYSLAINEISLAKFMINWRKHVLGPDDDVDHVWVRLTFAVPDGLTLEEHVPLTLFFGAYPIDGLNAEITPNGRRATYFEGDARNGDLPVVKMIVQLRRSGGQPLGIVYAVVRYADLDGELGALNETIVNGRLTVPVQLLIGAYEGCGSIEMRYDAKKNRKGKGKYPIR